MLTEIEIKNAKPHKLKDAHGLHLLVTANGSKLWRFRYRFEGRETMLGLGAHSPKSPEHVSLAKAREKCFVARGLLSEGRNLSAERKQPKASATNAAVDGVTFESAKKNGSPHTSQGSLQSMARSSNAALKGGSALPLPCEIVMSENAMLYAMYYLGYKGKATVHGFRGTFSTILNENDFISDHIEIQLSHGEEDEVRGAYNAAQWLPQRRKMMAWWADFLDERRAKAFQAQPEVDSGRSTA